MLSVVRISPPTDLGNNPAHRKVTLLMQLSTNDQARPSRQESIDQN